MAAQQATTEARSGNRERVKFETNIAQYLRLDSEGKLVTGTYGDQYQYFLDRNKIMWVDPDVHAAIDATGAGRGDEISIIKREVKNGNRRTMQWSVQLINDETTGDEPFDDTPAAAPLPPPAPARQPVRMPTPPSNEANRADRQAEATRQAQQEGRMPSRLPTPTQTEFSYQIKERMAWALRSAAALCADNGDFGQQFTTEDVAKIAITMFIEKDGRS